MKLHPPSAAFSLGLIGFAGVLVLGVWCSATGFGKPALDLVGSLYANIVRFTFDPSVPFFGNLGSNILQVLLLSVFTGLDGLILGYLGATLYNLFLPRETKDKKE